MLYKLKITKSINWCSFFLACGEKIDLIEKSKEGNDGLLEVNWSGIYFVKTNNLRYNMLAVFSVGMSVYREKLLAVLLIFSVLISCYFHYNCISSH